MAAKYIVGSVVGTFGLAYVLDTSISDKKIFGGSTPGTVSNKKWGEETDKKFQAWPRTAGPPVVMNPISRQNFIVKSGCHFDETILPLLGGDKNINIAKEWRELAWALPTMSYLYPCIAQV